MERKRVIFHLGAHKTASTYLQSVFSQQAENLKALGVDYPYPESGEVISTGACIGNVVKMLFENKLMSHNENAVTTGSLSHMWSSDCTNFITDIIKKSNYQTVLFSSEGMCRLSPLFFDDLYAKLNEFCDPEFIIFVRDPYDYSYSGWGQGVKSAYNTDSFSQFIDTKVKLYQSKSIGLFCNVDILATEKYKIINYDTYKKDLAVSFFSIADIDLDMKKNQTVQSVSVTQNRSLSPSEAKLQSLINQQFEGSQFPAFLRASLIGRPKYKPAVKKYYNQALDKLIIEAFKDDIAKINTHITGDSLRTQCRDADTTQLAIESQDINVLTDVFKEVIYQKTTSIPFISQFKHWAKCISLKHVPLDFEPKSYLFLNKDVAMANADPYLHYDKNGYREGRPYKIF
tara:strand:- start:430 stop:1629 length:1200 start_codon:yes stop_codon:yes gene_type:complete